MVKTLEETTHTFERLEFSVGKQIQAPHFGTVVQEVTLGKASLMLMMAKEKRTESHADEDTAGSGIVCLSITVQDLEATRAVIKARSGRTLEVYKGIYGNSVSIPAKLTLGIAIEFVQNARQSAFAVLLARTCVSARTHYRTRGFELVYVFAHCV